MTTHETHWDPAVRALVERAKAEALREALAAWEGGPTGAAPIPQWWLEDRADSLAAQPAPEAATVDGRTDPCPTPGYAGYHTAVGAGAISQPYRCHGCGAWFTLPEEKP